MTSVYPHLFQNKAHPYQAPSQSKPVFSGWSQQELLGPIYDNEQAQYYQAQESKGGWFSFKNLFIAAGVLAAGYFGLKYLAPQGTSLGSFLNWEKIKGFGQSLLSKLKLG